MAGWVQVSDLTQGGSTFRAQEAHTWAERHVGQAGVSWGDLSLYLARATYAELLCPGATLRHSGR